ncbi:MAG: AAA family ATPase, partial [Actinobacteria bacterium]|nr:AAA family ATPase [Actinomycetota bacterium]
MATCDRCGAENDPGARFCPACGAPRASQRSTGLEARKTVTILFCDTVGSTALGEATDPETTRRVMSRYADTMIGIVRDHGGTVERFRGDEVMAVFGVPAVHEDDALRAVRAGTAMQRALGRLNEDLDARFGVELTCRIGINTGEVVAGDPATAETFVTGDAVNLAKRLEQVADPGGIMIGTSTYALVKDAVKVGPRETFSAKGKSADVGRLRLEDVDASSAGYARRLDAPLVGRATELDQLLARIDTLFDEHRCGIVSLVGPAGVGKSRLSQEVVARYGEQARVASGRCLAYGSGITYWPLVELVRDLGGLAAVGRLLPATDDTETALEQVRAAIGESELTSPSDELFWGVRRMLEGLARERPLLVCLEDIHWAEPTMLDLVEYVAAFGTGPIALLCNARHELLEERPTWSREALVELSQLSEVETHELVGALGIDDPEARRTIASTAEGNPLFAEQLAAMVLESGPGSGGRLALPASIHALLAARLDGLDPAERRVLQRASIVGKEFWYRAVADLSPATDRPAVPSSLLSLSRKGLVTPVREDGATADTYRFHHTLIRDVAYAGIPKGVRAELHEGFAEWLESQPGGFGEHEEIVGYHVEQAQRYLSEVAPGDERALALARRAAGLLGEAGRRAFA